MDRLFLLRHAMPQVDGSVPPSEWALSTEGRAAARGLHGTLPPGAHRLASAERKAQETLQLALPGSFDTDDRLNEVRRPAEPFGIHFHSARRAWVAGRLDERHAAWEKPDAAAARFDSVLRNAPGGDLVVATHGMVLTSWLRWIGRLSPGEEAGQYWDALTFPAVIELARQ